MKKLSKVIALLLSGCLMLTSSAISVFAADDPLEPQTEVWDGKIDTSWYDAEESELHIFTAEELAGFAYLSNQGKKSFEQQTVFLENDINLNEIKWTPISNPFLVNDTNLYFKGIFNGQSHKIYGLKVVGSGLFGTVRGTIINTEICNCDISYTYSNVSDTLTNCGGICGSLMKSSSDGIVDESCKIDNCKVSGSISITSGKDSNVYAGGIAGFVYGGIINNCSADAKVSATKRNGDEACAGGICGGMGKTVIQGCASNCIVNAHVGGYQYASAGGICGACNEATDGIGGIYDCYSLGEITATSSITNNKGTTTSNYSYAGGIIGSKGKNVSLRNTYVVGSVTGFCCGAIAGYEVKDADPKVVSIINSYYQTSVAANGVGNGSDPTTAKSAANMKKEEFAQSLGDAFVYVEGSYPKLAWELEDTPANTDPAIAEMQLKVGESTQMTVTNYTGSVTWVSQNSDIVAIDANGIATGLKVGKATIFAILDSGKALSGTIQVVASDTIAGDCNNDGKLDIADAVSLQKWLLTEINALPNWIAADLNDDGYLNVVDLSIMKNMLFSKK